MLKTDETAINEQLDWIPRKMTVDGQEFEVQLYPMWIDAQADWCDANGIPIEVFKKGEAPDEYQYDEYYELKDFLNVYFYSADETVRITAKIRREGLSAMFPKDIQLPRGKFIIDHGSDTPGRIEWDNGVKQSLRAGRKCLTKDDEYDFVQAVMLKRRIPRVGGGHVIDATLNVSPSTVLPHHNDGHLSDKRYTFRVGGKTCTFELAPRFYNLWENAFATDSYNLEDQEHYERQKDYTVFMFVGLKRTLTVTATFPPDSTAVLKSIKLPKRVEGQSVLGSMTFEGDSKPVNIVSGHWDDTSADDLIEIERVRRGREQAGGAGAQQPVAPGVTVRAVSEARPAPTVTHALDEKRESEAPRDCRFRIKREGEAVEFDGKTYEFAENRAWANLQTLIDGGGELVRCDKGLKKFFKCKDAKAFYKAAIQPKGAGRKGDGTYRLNI